MRALYVRASMCLAVGLAFSGILGCGKSGNSTKTTPPQTSHTAHYHAVSIQNFAFSPSALTVSVADTVAWTNNDTTTHTVTSDSGSELGSTVNQGQTYVHVFAQAGSYPYHCAIHTTMHGSVTVQ